MEEMVPDFNALYSDQGRGGLPIFFPMPATPITWSFDQGLAAEETFPLDDLCRIAEECVGRDTAQNFEYGDLAAGYDEMIYGYGHLRERLAALIRHRDGRVVTRHGVVLTSGSVQAIAMAINGYVDPGDGVIVEAPSFPYALRYIQSAGGKMVSVPVDSEGMDVGAVEKRLIELKAEGVRTKMVYTIPTFQLPTGTCLSLERRQNLVELAREWGFVILEDNVYGDLRFEGPTLPTLLSLDSGGFVIQADSFSKTVAPGLRLGWLAGTPDAVAGAVGARQDLGVSQWMARIMEQFMGEGRLAPHIEHVNKVYKRKRDCAVAALKDYCEPWLTLPFGVPKGAFYLWGELSAEVDGGRLQELAATEGVLARPGEAFFGAPPDRQFLRIAYSATTCEEIDRGMEVLGRAIAESLRG